METVRIGSETKNLADADPHWINDQVDRRRRDGQNVCVEMFIQTSGLDLRLATPGCGSGGGGGGRQANAREAEVIGLWNARKLNQSDFTGGNLVAFIQQLRRLLP